MTKAYAYLLNLVTCLARKVPMPLSSALDALALRLARLSRRLPPMPRASLQPGAPFIGKGVCEDIECREEWTVYSPYGGDEMLVLCCPACDQDTGVIA